MTRLIIITIFLLAGKAFGQTTKVAGSTSANAPVVYTQLGADNSKKKSIDSLADVLRLEFAKVLKDSMAAQRKLLTDSFATLLPIDNKTLVVQNGKAIAVASVQSVLDSTTSVAKNVSALTVTVNNLSTSTNTRLNSLEGWRTTTNTKIGEIEIKVATIPKTAISTSTSTTTTTTVTELK